MSYDVGSRFGKGVACPSPASQKDIFFNGLLLCSLPQFLVSDLFWPLDHKNLSEAGGMKLPVVTGGRSSLVASPILLKSNILQPREIAANWAKELRTRINENVECHEDVNEDDIMNLKKQLIAVFISTLQTNSREQWSVFVEILALLEPYKEYFDYFETKAEFHHYLERVLHHVELHKSKLFDLQVEAYLTRVFPEHIKHLRVKGITPAKGYGTVPTPLVTIGQPSTNKQLETPSPRKSHKYPSSFLPDGTNPYSLLIPSEEEIIGAKGLTLRDINKSMGAVALEMAARESAWKQSLGTTALALAADIPVEEKIESRSDQVSETMNKVLLTPRKKTTPRPVPNMQDVVLEMNGREAVQFFAASYHMGKVKSIYLNLAPNRHYRPYDLISVPKSKINPEHYVFTTFGAVHVYPDQPSESLTLAEWQRDAVLWGAISKIPFFKNYLINKMFYRWRKNCKLIDFQRKQNMIRTNLLSATPSYGAALLQISKLLKELLTVPFMPTETDKTYQLTEFENNINYKNIQAEKFLSKFFKYCKLIIDFTSDEAFKKIQYCEEQLKKKALFSKDSLSMQRLKKEDREKNLANAQQEASFLGNFVKLVDQLIVEHMFEITKTQSISFVHNVLVMSPDAQREGFFKANLIFGKDAELVLSPSKKRFKKALDSTFKNISTVLMSKSIDFDIWSHEKDPLEGELSSRSDGFKQSEKLSTPTHTDRQSEAASYRSASRRSLTSGSNKTAAESRNPARLSLGNSSTMSSSVDLSFPNLSQKAFPSKEEDELGVATPDLIIMHPEDNDIKVEGQGFLGQYEPLTKANLEEKLLLDPEYQQVLNKQRDLMLVALQDVDSYCEKHQWLNEIHKFCSVWSKKSLEEFKSAAAFNIEQKLTELRQWSERVKSFDVSYVTENGLFYIDCSAIHEGLLPRLNDIYQEIVSFVAEEVNCLAQNLIQEMSQILKNMSNKKSEVLLFANLAKNFHIYKKNTLVYQQRVEYIKSLYEVIRMSYRQLTSEEEKTEEKVFSSWEAFQMQMQETSEFVNTQTPLQLSQLEAAFQRLQKEAITQYELATTGKFLDPHQSPVMILADMKMIREKFFALQSKLHEVSHCREAITGEPYNLRFLQDMISKMDLRQELWKYVEVTTHTIKDWNQTLFKKMNFKKALEKISVWQSAASRLTSLLPRGDQVLEAWIRQVEEFSKHLPVLCQLSHDALQERHWQTIFLGMNVPYNPNAQLTVADLLSFNLADHADLINRVYLSALTENNVTSRLDTIISFWQERHFKLAKYLPDSLYNKEQPKRSTSSNARIKKLERYRQERAAAQAGSQRGLDVSSDDFYVLIEVEELKYHLEDSRITLDSMLASPHVNDVKSQVEFLCQALREIEEITDLWFDCQKKWQYLVKIFEQPILYQTLSEHAFKFESVHNKFKDWMRVSSSDSKCMSVINRRRGEKGYRLLQGDNLRVLLQSLIKDQEEILKDLGGYIEKCRATFHRLYFLSNDEIFEMLAVSKNPPALLPFVRLCFPHVENLTFSLPTAMGGLNSQLDISLNSDKLEVACITGSLGEELPLYTKVEPGASAPKWLHNINQVLKNTLTIALKACVQARLEEGTKHPVLVLEELAKLSHSHPKPAQEEITHEIKSIFRQWLLRFPAQSVLTAEAILWERSMSRSLDKKDKEELKNQKLLLHAKLDQLTRVLVEFQSVTEMTETDQQRLNLLISALLTQSIYYRDIMSNLIETNQVSDSAFDWLKILKLRMDIRNVLRAKTVVTEKPPEDSIRSRTVRKNPTTKRKRELRVQEAPKLARTQTTVTNDYQFSTCYAQQLNQVFTYDYEYLGPYNQLVITPLTERVFLSMGQALKSFHCSALIGPNGTGKTETIHELGKLLGRCLFTITCHNTVTLPVMLQYLTGLVQSGCWAVFDDCDRLTKGLMSVVGQQLDYLRTALRALAMTSENQYQIRGNSHFDKVFAMKSGIGDKVIRRNSLTTLHPLPKPETEFVPILERQKTVPHGFNEKGLVTYFEDTWVAERDQRRHSIEREIKIQESELYKSNKPPPLFYEHVKASRRRSQPDYSKLTSEPSYVHRMLGNVMFNGKLLQASCNFGCFMTMNATSAASSEIPYSFRILMRPCAIIVPDVEYIVSVHLESNGYEKHSLWAKKLVLLFKQLESQIWRQKKHLTGLHQMKQVLKLAVGSKLKSLSTEKLDGEECNKEELSIVFAVKELMSTAAESESERAIFNNILRQIFPQATGQQTSSTGQEQQLITAVAEIFDEDGMERNELMLSKIMELYKSLDSTSSVILAGQPGSGKTKLCHALAKAINLLNYKMVSNDATKEENRSQSQVSNHHSQNIQSSIINKDGRDLSRFPKVDMVHIFPGSMTPDQLLGSFEDGVWKCGLLSKILKDSYTKWLATMSFVQTFKSQDKKLAKYTAAMPSILKRWIMIDGSLHPLWTEGIKTLLDSEKHLSQGSGETIQLKDLTKIIFETTDLKTAAPSSVAHSVVIYLGPGTTNWSSLYFNWKQTANNRWLLSAEGLKVLDEIISDLFPATIKFLSTHCQSALLTDVGQVCTAANQVTPGISEVSAFLNIFSALLDRSLKREEKDRKHLIDDRSSFSSTSNEDGKTPTRHSSSSLTNTSQIEAVIPNYQEHLKNIFAFAYIWAFGGHLHDRYKETFSNFAHNALYRTPHPIQLPSAGHVFDYYLDEKTSEFANWSCRQQQDRIKNLAGFYVIPEVDRYSYLTEFLMSANIPILLAGAPGVGKTSFVQSMILSKLPSTEVIMSNGLTSSILQDLILAHVSAIQNKNNPRPGGPSSSLLDQSKHLFFIDDLNMAQMIGDYQPPLELMRCLLSTGGMHDRNRKEFLKTKEASFIAATTIPSCPGSGLGKACHLISTRLTRHFVNLTVFSPSEDSLVTLFSKPLQTWLEEFPTFAVEHTYEFSRAMSSALLDLYQTVRDKLLPSPSKPHYIFSLHDLSKVVQGILLLSPRIHLKKGKTVKKNTGKKADEFTSAPMMKVIAQLWCHEVSRNFGDRLINCDDLSWFSQTVETLVVRHFCSPNLKYNQENIIEEKAEESSFNTDDTTSQQNMTGNTREDNPQNHDTMSVNQGTASSSQKVKEALDPAVKSQSSTKNKPRRQVSYASDPQPTACPSTQVNYKEKDLDLTLQTEDENFNQTDESDSDSSCETSASDDIEISRTLDGRRQQTEEQHNRSHKMSTKSQVIPEEEKGLYKRQDSNKKVVSFKAGLLADKKHVLHSGPLLSINEIKGTQSDLTNFIFSKFYLSCHAELVGIQAEKGYTQQSEEKITEALYSCLEKYNKGTSQRLDLVFFSEAVHHAARLSRVLAQPKGHALLLGMSYCTGRATLTRLAAYVAHCKLFEAKTQSHPGHNLQVLRRYIKLSCFHAGVSGKQTVLLVHEDLGEEGLYDIASIMAEGTAPGLYSETEIQDIVGQLLPGGVQTKKVEKIEQVFNKYIKRIKQNLHVIVCLNYKGNNFSTQVNALHNKLQKHPGLLKHCVCIDIFLPWSFKSLAQVAKTWLQDNKSGVAVPWNPQHSNEQLEATANAMAFIHLSSKTAIERQFCHQREPLRIFTPLTFLEFVHLFKTIAAFLVKTERAKGKKYEQALNKINEAFGSIADYRNEVSDLVPQQVSAARQVTDLVAQVESSKQNYIKALEQCKIQEETIYQLQNPLESLRQTAQTEFDKVNPIYQAAVKVLDNLDLNSVEELRSYPSPPDGVKYVMKAVCLLFNKPQTWEGAKALMVNPDFFQELIFYKKDDIPEPIFQEMKKFVNDPSFVPESIAQASSAASSICAWIHAVYAYSTIQRKMKPRMKDLMEAENKFTQAQAQLGQFRVEAQQIKTNLEQYIDQHKEAIKVAKAIEKQIQAVEKKIARASNLMDNMSMQHFLWRSELKKSRKQITCAPGDALLTAACVAYHGPLDDKSRLDLMQNWLELSKQNTLNAQTYEECEPYSITAKLEFLKDSISQHEGHVDSDDQSEAGGDANDNNFSLIKQTCPQVKTFKYISAVYDSSKYYRSELKRQGTMESVGPEQEFIEDDDDDDENVILPTRPNLTLQDILSDFDELSEWRMLNLPTDLHSVQNALMMRVCCHNRKHCWPLLIDPDNQAEMWVKALHKSHNIFTQKDVADFVVDDDIPYDESFFKSEDAEDTSRPPPSRETMLTYNLTESSQYSYSRPNT
ncbi:dynein heavy chain domain-containing protein 1, partial [Biomphalaria glabrata]